MKEIDITKEFEYKGYEYVVNPNQVESIRLLLDFCYFPASVQRRSERYSEVFYERNIPAYVVLINVFLSEDKKQDIYFILDPKLISRIENDILQDLRK